MSDRIFVSTIEDSPGRIHIALFEGHGADQVAMRKELTAAEMQHMHALLTKALWDRYRRQERENDDLRAEMQNLAADLISGARRP